MKYLIICFFFVILSVNVYSQTIVSSKLIDMETREPIEFVTVTTNNTYTATNELGEFEITNAGDFLVFSHVGYHQLKLQKSLLPKVIEMQPRVVVANDVIVKPDYAIKHLKEVQKKYYDILKKHKNDLPKATFYYRQQTKTGNNFNEFVECFFTGSNGVSISDLSLKNGRYATVKASDSVYTFSFTNAFIFSQIPPVSDKPITKSSQLIVPLSPDFFKYYNISLEYTLDSNNENEIKVYKFDPNEWSLTLCPNPIIGGVLYVRSKDNVILRFIGNSSKSAGINIDSAGIKILSTTQRIDLVYKDKYDFPIVESAKVEIFIRRQGILAGKTIDVDASIKTIMFATEIENRKSGKKIQIHDELLKKVADTKYNPTFWKNNSVIMRTPIENQIIEDFTHLGYFGNFAIK